MSAINIETSKHGINTSGKHGINTGDQVMNNTDPGRKRKIDDNLIYEPSMVMVGWLPVVLVVWALTLLSYFMLP